MNIRQLRPEQKKLWRRIYLQAMGRDGNAENACKEADAVVAHWEARGAFDEELSANAGFVQPFGVVFPGDLSHMFRLITTYHLCDDIVVAAHKEPASYMLVAWSERGKQLVSFAMANGIASMLDRVISEARNVAQAAALQSAAKNASVVS